MQTVIISPSQHDSSTMVVSVNSVSTDTVRLRFPYGTAQLLTTERTILFPVLYTRLFKYSVVRVRIKNFVIGIICLIMAVSVAKESRKRAYKMNENSDDGIYMLLCYMSVVGC